MLYPFWTPWPHRVGPWRDLPRIFFSSHGWSDPGCPIPGWFQASLSSASRRASGPEDCWGKNWWRKTDGKNNVKNKEWPMSLFPLKNGFWDLELFFGGWFFFGTVVGALGFRTRLPLTHCGLEQACLRRYLVQKWIDKLLDVAAMIIRKS